MAEKIANMQKGWEVVGISVGHVTLFRAFVLAILGIASFMAIETYRYTFGIVSFCCFTIVLSVFAIKPVLDYEYRGHYDFLHAAKVTREVIHEIKHDYGEKETSSIIRKIQTDLNPNPFWIRLGDYQSQKPENGNVLILGMNGTGKTTLGIRLLAGADPEYQKIVAGYKRKDSGRFQKLGYERWDMRQHRVDPWTSTDDFVRSLVTAINLDPGSGITANSVRDLAHGLIHKSNNWPELFLEIKATRKEAGYDSVTRMALARIESALNVIYDPNAKYFQLPTHNVFLDYSEVKDRTITVFDSEFLLGLLYGEIISEKRRNVILYIEETHRLLRNKYDKGNNVSIIEDLITREIRDTGSKIWISTQSAQDINPTARDQFASVYVHRTLESKTLAELREISELLAQAVVDLDTYNFADIGQNYHGTKVSQEVFHFRLYPRNVEEPSPEPRVASPTARSIHVPADQLQAPQASQQAALPSQAYLLKIVEMLGKKPMTTQEIATELVIAEEKPRDAAKDWKPSSEQVNAMKMKVKDPCLQLLAVHDGELADVLLLQDKYRDKPKSLYYFKDKGEKGVHTRLMAITREELEDPERRITKIAEGKDRDGPDFEIPGYIVEVESGLRRGNMTDLEDRIAKEVKKENDSRSVIIVVPNDSTREKYKKHFAKTEERVRDRVTVLVLYELGYHLDSLIKRPLTSEERI